MDLSILDTPATTFNDERDGFWKSDTPDMFANRSFKEVVESALYTSDNMFGEIAFEAERELMRRLMKLYPPPDWAKGKR
jgi:hypothetical protein